jgi:hypothetical protein
MSFTAMHRGECVDCQEPITPGQEIASKSYGEYRHVRCPKPALTAVDLAPGETPCPSCFLVHAGGCF